MSYLRIWMTDALLNNGPEADYLENYIKFLFDIDSSEIMTTDKLKIICEKE